MLSLLHIDNIALIESADISFDRGFNVLTGETGAGKSIVIDSIGAVIGQRTSRDLIRTGAKSALVTAEFTGLPDLPWFAENGLGPDEEGSLLLQREIQPDGKNVCRLNGRLLTVSQLRELGRQLVNIHGQHDGQQLLDESTHLGYLDSFGGTGALRDDYQSAYEALQSVRREMESLRMDEAEKARRIDSLQFQIGELERAGLKPGEEEALLERRDLLRSAGKITGALEQAHMALSGDEERDGAAAQAGQAAQALQSVAGVSAPLGELAGRLEELRCMAEDLSEQVRDLRGEFDFEPGALDQIESRLDVLYRLKKKYGATEADMIAYLARCQTELETIQDAGDALARLEKREAQAYAAAEKKAEALSRARRKAAAALEKRIQTELEQLDMPRVRFQTDLRPKAGGLDATGMDEVQFLMSANLGEALKPIQKVASGGELARIMLALKNVLAENEAVTTLIFDEVDTGVSGRAAQKVAEKMADVARHKQVLCVTHLPQIAAMADVHFAVSKGISKGRTFTQVERLDPDRRKEELARLTGGANITLSMLAGAGELLEAAQAYKERGR